MQSMPIFEMKLGERRRPCCAVRCEGVDAPNCRNAKWELGTRDGLAAAGDCEVTEADGYTELAAIIEPEEPGDYGLTFWYDLGREHLAAEAKIIVR